MARRIDVPVLDRPRRRTVPLLDSEALLRALADDSGDEVDISSDEESIYDPSYQLEHVDSPNEESLSSDKPEEEDLPEDICEPSTSTSKKSTKKPTMKWERKVFNNPIHGELNNTNENIENEDILLQRPIDYFSKYFNDDILQVFVDQSNLKHVQDKLTNLKTSLSEIKTLIGAHIVMGCLHYPRLNLYWAQATRIPLIADHLTRDRFSKLRNYLHLVNNLEDKNDQDKLWKIRPLLNRIREECLKIPRENRASIDEQMIPFSGQVSFRQYMKNKPNPLGIKNFVLALPNGMVLDFEIYQGKGTNFNEAYKAEYGVGGAVVLHLAESIPKNTNYCLYFDRFFTSIHLLQELLKSGIHGMGTVMKNRLPGTDFQTDKVLKTKGRGSFDELVSEDNKLTTIKWFDNKPVLLISSSVGSQPVTEVKRWDRQEKAYIMVKCPAVIAEYNAYMGGVDLSDFLISLYRISIRTKKWPLRVIFHFVDLCLSNSWIQYRSDSIKNGKPKREILDLFSFRLNVATSLIKYESRGTDGRLSTTPKPKRKREYSRNLPDHNMRYDSTGHWPEHVNLENAARCRRSECKSKSRIRCIKCNVFLCVRSDENNCFMMFHAQ